MKYSRKFWAGVILIIVSYVSWGGTFLCGALAVKYSNKAYIFGGTIFYALSWALFGLGLVFAGKEGYNLLKFRVINTWYLFRMNYLSGSKKLIDSIRNRIGLRK